MKKILLPIILIVCLSIVLFTKKDVLLTKEEALLLGEEKYLKFLWMVDGAFNNDRLKEEFMVNNKKLDKKDKIFTCKYHNSSECIGNNFESEFNKLFSSNINYEKVYSDGILYSWITYKNNKYYFSNLDTCNINRMDIKQSIEVIDINSDKIVYEVINDNKKRDFILINENNEWKIDTAFYHDLCGMKYFIY